MKYFRIQKAASVVVFFAAFVFCASLQAQQHTLRIRHIPDVVRNGRASAVGQLETDHPLHLVINLPLRNEDALDALLQQIYDPQSPNFHHYLSSQQFTDSFSPSQQDYDTVVAWAKAKGLQVTSTTVNRRLVEVEGPVGTINRAFNVLLKTYRDDQNARTFHAPDREPTVDLAVPLLAISGLDDANPPHTHLKKREGVDVRPSGTITENLNPSPHAGSGPGGYYLPSDMRAAYYGTGPLDGHGQTVAIFSFDDYPVGDLNVFYTNSGMTTTVPVNTVHVNGYNTPCWGFNSNGTINYNTCDDAEQILDIVNVQGMAPGLTQVLFYVNLSASAVLNQIAIDNTASVITSSWGGGDFGSASDFYFKEFQAQGQTYFNATGDLGQFNSSTYDPPSVDANITQVGGTDLTTMGAGGPWSSETGWADSGGGYFTGTAIPAWQQLTGVINVSNQGSTTLRNAPDVAAEGNFDNPTVLNGTYSNGYGGTSFAAPRWAGYLALANQQAALNGNGRIGFLNPTIYNIGVGSNFTNNFHDITSGRNAPGAGSGSGFNAVTGYDLVTGWGSPNGTTLINTLASMAGTPDFSFAASPNPITIVQGNSGTSTVTITDIAGFTGAVALSATTLPTGVTASFSPASTTSTSVLTLTVASSVSVGLKGITVTGTSGSLTHSVNLSLNVTAAPDYSLSASPSSVTAVRSGGTTSIVTITPLNSFSGSVALSASGLPAGVTAAFSPSSATTSSTLTLAASSTATLGQATVTITGTSGSLTHTTTVTLTVVAAPDYSLSATSASVVQGASGTSTVTVTDLNSFSGAVALSASGLPSGVTASFSPASATTTSTLTLTASSTATVGAATVTITGTSGSLTHTTTLTLTVVAAPDYSLSATSASVVQGASGTSTITVTPLNSFNGAVALTASGLPTGVTASFSPASATTTSTLTLTASSTATVGSATVTVTGTSGSQTHTATFTLTVTAAPDYSLSATSATVVQGASGTSTITVNALNSFSGSVALSASGLPAGVTASFSPASATTTSTLTLTASSTATVGSATVTITGTSGSLTHTATFTLTVVAAPDYSLSATSASVVQGASGTSTITVNALNSFSGSVALSATGLPSGVTASFSPASATTTSTLTLTASSTATVGAATVTITGTSGSLTHTTTLTLTVVAAPDYSLSASPVSIAQGASGTSTVAVTGVNGFAGSVSLSASGLPAGVTASFSPASTTSTSTLTFTASSTATVGTAIVTVTGTSGSLTRSTTVALTVTAAALNPSLAINPIAEQVIGAAPFSVGFTSLSSGAVTFSVLSGPVTVSGNTITVTGAGTVVLQASQAAAGSYTSATVTTSFIVLAKAITPTLAFVPIPGQPFSNAIITLSATSNSTGAITYTVLSGPATVSGNALTMTGLGKVSLSATQAASTPYAVGTATTSFTISSEAASLTLAAVPDHIFGDAPFTVSATSLSPAPIVYSVTSGKASVSGNTVTLSGSGTVILAAKQAATGNFAAGSTTITFNVAPGDPGLTFNPVPDASVGEPAFVVIATSPSFGTITYAVLSGPATVSGHKVTVTAVGTVVLQATQAASGSYTAGTATTSFNVGAQRITPTLVLTIPNQLPGAPTFAIAATSNSPGAITYAITSGPATIAGNLVTVTGLGTVTVTATQAATSVYSPATTITSFTVAPLAPTLVITPIASQPLSSAIIPVSTTSNSAGAITVSVTGPVVLSGSSLTMTGVGKVIVTATQVASGSFSAITVSTFFYVTAALPNLTLNAVPDHTFGDAPFTVSATSLSPAPIVYSISAGKASVSGSTVTLSGSGAVTITAKQAATGNFAAASTTTSFNVALGNPNLTFNPIPDQTVGALAFAITATSPSFGAITYSVLSGPATVSGHKVTVTGVGTVTLQATQTASGSYTVGTATTSFNVTQP